MRLLHLGDLDLALPLGAALAMCLFAAGAWRMALRWGLCFGAAVTLVAGSKIAFLGWGTALSALDFKALSGHATLVTSLYPVLAWTLLVKQGPVAARLALASGLALGALVAWLLVITGEHSALEAIGGWLLGAGVCLASLAPGPDLARARLVRGLCWSLPVFAIGVWLMESAHVGYWMVRLALALSGNHRPYPWDTCS